MSNKHSFNQTEVLMLGYTKTQKDQAWEVFKHNTRFLLGLSITVTGNSYLTHEINCDEATFNTLLEITRETLHLTLPLK